ncbi:hypothetical protein KP509_06G027600 [Ceratopteris richardii]|uniref:Protein kinase domain-containing protein n=1 Tax=Ceratopteris richardii TaxID=49495 RepID=A0A8T2UMP6_CERRI|nr:hypothetical protein KP509_06G027600 [Ceratopteris richardii]
MQIQVNSKKGLTRFHEMNGSQMIFKQISFMLLMILYAPGHSLATPQNFEFASFNNDRIGNVTFVTQDSWYGGQDAQLGSDGAIWLNPDPSLVQTRAAANIGKVAYINPINFKSPKFGMASFSTSFRFKITTTRPYPNCGSGMVFFIAEYVKPPEKSYGRYFGMVSPNALNAERFLAIEFDTHISTTFYDISGSHIGIDINSLESAVVADSSPNSTQPEYYPELFLYNNFTFTTWIDYNSSSNLIQVWMSNSSLIRPSQPILSYKYDLSEVFNETMFVGFSATNNASEDGMEGHVLYSWNFTAYFPLYREPKKFAHGLRIPFIIAGVLLSVILIFCVSFFLWRRKISSSKSHPLVMGPFSGSVTVPSNHSLPYTAHYSLKQLKKATNNFGDSNIIGEGGFSYVYKGILEDGRMIAVKRLKVSLHKDKREAEFISELKVISNIRHRNLLQLEGWCHESEEAILVYKFMSKGSLVQYIYGNMKGSLSSNTRLKILAGIASALEYLHFGLGDCVLHRDVKAANVLLTDEYEPLLGDFGLARLISHGQVDAITMTAAGTTGYIAPEVVFSGRFSDKADVYGFGVLMLEVACGRRAIDNLQLNTEQVRLVEWVWNLHVSNNLLEALDWKMRLEISEFQIEQWRKILHIALMCCNPSPDARPNMRLVCTMIEGDDLSVAEPLTRSRKWEPLPIENWPSASSSATRSSTKHDKSQDTGPMCSSK